MHLLKQKKNYDSSNYFLLLNKGNVMVNMKNRYLLPQNLIRSYHMVQQFKIDYDSFLVKLSVLPPAVTRLMIYQQSHPQISFDGNTIYNIITCRTMTFLCFMVYHNFHTCFTKRKSIYFPKRLNMISIFKNDQLIKDKNHFLSIQR